jgi:hypothetical protein
LRWEKRKLRDECKHKQTFPGFIRIFSGRDGSRTNDHPIPIRVNSRPFAANAFAFGCGFVAL